MYDQSLPPTSDSIESAGIWVRGIARQLRPDLADRAEKATRQLVSQAIRRTPADQLVHVHVEAADDGLLIEVRDPYRSWPMESGPEWRELSSVEASFGARRDEMGHVAWTHLRTFAETA